MNKLIVFDAPVPKALTSYPRDALSPIAFLDGLAISLVNNASGHEGEHKDPNIAALHASPPATFDTYLPEAVDASPRGVEEHATAGAALNPGPETGEETTQEEALGSEEGLGEPGLEDADRGPGGGDGTRDEGGRSESTGEDAV